MQCTQVEDRLNQLLDQRRHGAGDPELVAHCAICPQCRAIADAYAALEHAVSLAKAAPELPGDLSERVLSDIGGITKSLTAAKRVSVSRAELSWKHWMIAAALLVAAVPCALLLWSNQAPQISLQESAAPFAEPGAVWQFDGNLAHLLDEAGPSGEHVWRSTGRGIAELPRQVRRAAALSESVQLNAAIRPVAVAWHALRRVLPGEAIRPEPAEGKTGSFNQLPTAIWA